MCNSLLPTPDSGPGFEESNETSILESPFGRVGLELKLVSFALLKTANLMLLLFITPHRLGSFTIRYTKSIVSHENNWKSAREHKPTTIFSLDILLIHR